jgi:hypothetical protein
MQSAYFGMAATPGVWSQRAKDRAAAVAVDALLRAGDVLLDIGVRDAAPVLAAAARVGPLGHVHVFEAPDGVLQEAADEIARLDLAHVTLHQLALSQANGHTQRFVTPLVGGRPFGVRIDLACADAAVLAPLLAFEHLRFVVAQSGADPRGWLATFSAGGWAVFAVKHGALRCRLERLDDGALPQEGHDAIAVRLPPATVVPQRLHPQQLASLLGD